MLIQAQVGPAVSSTSLGVGTNPNLRLDNMGGLAATQLNPRYYETTYRRQTYTVANQSAQTTTTTLTSAAAYTGLLIQNPTTSTVNVVITKVGWAAVAASTTNPAAISIITGTGTSITSGLTPRNRFVGSVGAQCLASQSVNLPGTAVVETVLGHQGTTLVNYSQNIIDLEGSLILPPGAYAAFYTSAVITSGFWGSFQWVEVPL